MGGRRSLESREQTRGLAFVAPWLVGFSALFVVPLLLSFAASFTSFELVETDGRSLQWVGLDNWRELVSNDDVLDGVLVTLRFALLYIPVSLLVPLALAYLLTSRNLWAKGLFRATFFVPSIVPLVAAMMVWQFFLNDRSGWLPRLFRSIGIDPPLVLGDPDWVLATLAFISIWGIGTAMMLYIAALDGIPQDLYEAAHLDGAGSWQLFRDITLPMLSPVTLFNLIITLTGLGQYFLVPFVLLGPDGNPEGATDFFTLIFYRETFVFFQAGYGATLAWAMFLVVLAVSALLFWTSKYWVHYEYEERP